MVGWATINLLRWPLRAPTLLSGLLRPVPRRYLISGGLDHCIKVWNPLLTKVTAPASLRP